MPLNYLLYDDLPWLSCANPLRSEAPLSDAASAAIAAHRHSRIEPDHQRLKALLELAQFWLWQDRGNDLLTLFEDIHRRIVQKCPMNE